MLPESQLFIDQATTSTQRKEGSLLTELSGETSVSWNVRRKRFCLQNNLLSFAIQKKESPLSLILQSLWGLFLLLLLLPLWPTSFSFPPLPWFQNKEMFWKMAEVDYKSPLFRVTGLTGTRGIVLLLVAKRQWLLWAWAFLGLPMSTQNYQTLQETPLLLVGWKVVFQNF